MLRAVISDALERAKASSCKSATVSRFSPKQRRLDMISPSEARKAVDYLIDSAAEYAAARADQARTENMLRVVKSLAMKASGASSAAAQEREAYASQEYRDAIDENFAATKDAEKIRALREGAKMKIEAWRSFNSNLKGAERGFGSAA